MLAYQARTYDRTAWCRFIDGCPEHHRFASLKESPGQNRHFAERQDQRRVGPSRLHGFAFADHPVLEPGKAGLVVEAVAYFLLKARDDCTWSTAMSLSGRRMAGVAVLCFTEIDQLTQARTARSI